MKRMLSALVLVVATFGIASCSSSSSGGDSGCENMAGTWKITGDCGPDTCVVTQTGCSTKFACGGGSVGYTGSISGSSVSYGGKTASGYDGSCSGTLNGATITGTCSAGGGSCALTAQKQ